MSTLAEKLRSGLLELRTEAGPLYASLSISERIYLLWTFRNFHRLPQQVLNPRQRQLIDKLIHASTLRRLGPAVTSPIIGTVENVHLMSERKPVAAASASKVVEIAKARAEAAMARAVGSEEISVQIRPQAHSGGAKAPVDLRTIDLKVRSPHSDQQSRIKKPSAVLVHPGASTRAHRWLGPSIVAGLGVALMLLGLNYSGKSRPTDLRLDEVQSRSTPLSAAAADLLAQLPNTAVPDHAPKPSAARPVGQLQIPAIPIRATAAISTAIQPATGAAMQPPTPASTSSPATPAVLTDPLIADVSTNSPLTGESEGRSAAISSRPDESPRGNAGIAREVVAMTPTPPDRVVIAAAPRSFSYPAAPNATLTGKVNLKVIIGGDGSVREVRVISGNRVLADAAVRAVRRWRYRPAELNGHAAEAETNVSINFAGDDAVTIAYR